MRTSISDYIANLAQERYQAQLRYSEARNFISDEKNPFLMYLQEQIDHAKTKEDEANKMFDLLFPIIEEAEKRFHATPAAKFLAENDLSFHIKIR